MEPFYERRDELLANQRVCQESEASFKVNELFALELDKDEGLTYIESGLKVKSFYLLDRCDKNILLIPE